MSERDPVASEDFEDLYENAPCGYLLIYPDGRICKANTTFATWLEFTPEQLVRKRLHELLNIAGRIFYETHFAPLLRMQGFFNEVALDFVTQSGGLLPVLVNATERRGTDERVLFTRLTVFNATDRRRYERELVAARTAAEVANKQLQELNDSLATQITAAITERLKAEDTLRQSQKMEALGQLTGGIAHDFNNLLTGIIGSIDIVRRRLASERIADIPRFMDIASTSAHRAAVLTHRLLAFARRQSLDTRSNDVNRLVASMEDLLKRTFGKDVELQTVLANDLWPALTDANQFENAILNLAINARDAMPDGGKLTIETVNTRLDADYVRRNGDVESGDYVEISVSDTGKGMPPDVVARACDPFFTTKPIGQGTGLGLSMIYGFAKQSRGHLRIYSEVGQGTTVKLYLARAMTDVAESLVQVDVATPRGHGEAILVVEDDATVRLLIVSALEDLGYEHLEAADAGTAMAILQSHRRIDLLITDVSLPVTNGHQLAKFAREIRPDLKVLFVTGYAETAAVRGGFLAGGMEMLTKPFALDALGTKIQEMIKR
ncbi:MAG: response regulator [Acidiphilium sp.]|nr:response regulator [Acidiphilium sp.]MDD4935080.1 response regulator [Acidiphilium sp.]